MRVCAGCTSDYEETFSFCPHCGRAFGGGEQADRLNMGLRNMQRAATREGGMGSRKVEGALVTEAAKEGAAILATHDPLFASMVED